MNKGRHCILNYWKVIDFLYPNAFIKLKYFNVSNPKLLPCYCKVYICYPAREFVICQQQVGQLVSSKWMGFPKLLKYAGGLKEKSVRKVLKQDVI
jgi:hypothetical protein